MFRHGHRFGHEFGRGLGHRKIFNFGLGIGHGIKEFGHGLGQSHDFGHGHVRKPYTSDTYFVHACPLISVLLYYHLGLIMYY